jgi:hypothetical protein
MKIVRTVVSALAVALVCSWAPAAAAQQNQQRQHKQYKATRAITVDQQTGALRVPTAQETQELVDGLETMTNRSTVGLQPATHPNGTKAVNLQGRFQSVILARPNPDGTSETRCVTTFEEAADFLGLVEDKGQQ